MTFTPSLAPRTKHLGSRLLLCVSIILGASACSREEPPPAAQHANPAAPRETPASGTQQEPVLPEWVQEVDPEEETAMGPGRWRKFRTNRFDENLTKEQRERIEKLESIGYLRGSKEAGGDSGVIGHDPERSYAGLNFYTSGHAPEAILVDMKGQVLHKWAKDFWEVWPDYPTDRSDESTQCWRRVYLYENGDILAIYEGLGIVKLDKDSNMIWGNPCRAHHDLEVMPNGDIYVLTREAGLVPRVSKSTPILQDFISLLDANGKERKRVSLLESLENSKQHRHFWDSDPKRTGDIFHTNTIEVLDGRIGDKLPAFKKGNILTSFCALDVIAVVDFEKEEVAWAHKGGFHFQHDPKILENGHLQLFDNLSRIGQSGVLEYDPVTMDVVWEYRGSDRGPFFSRTCGAAQRLPNGNTLISESDPGRAIEIMPDGTVVWEFINPNRAGENDEYIGTLFEVVRLRPGFPVGWAQQQPNAASVAGVGSADLDGSG